MSLSFLPETPKIDIEKGPILLAGAASPLWLMFGGAAMAGATWWWWSARWREAVNIEAMMAPSLADFQASIDPVTEAPVLAPITSEPVVVEPITAEAVAETVAETVQETLDTVEVVAVETQQTLEVVREPVVEAVVEQAKAVGDDLTLLVGIGPKLAAALAELGVTRFSEIAAWGPEELAAYDAELSLKGRAERDAWVAQAKRLSVS
jgi:predicted flap endonuclease-1-like 5' DNA nuclease